LKYDLVSLRTGVQSRAMSSDEEWEEGSRRKPKSKPNGTRGKWTREEVGRLRVTL
jgi:hypothetical protein